MLARSRSHIAAVALLGVALGRAFPSRSLSAGSAAASSREPANPDLPARLVMVPRRKIVAIPHDVTLPQIEAIVRHRPFSHYPVFLSSLDDVVGVISVEELQAVVEADPLRFDLNAYLSLPLFVPAGQQIDGVLTAMQAHRSALAVVVDDYGQTAGIVTLHGGTSRPQNASIARHDWSTAMTVRGRRSRTSQHHGGRRHLALLEPHPADEQRVASDA